METHEFIITLLVLYSSAASSVLGEFENKYEHELPSGRKVICDRCPPGFHLRAHCTETQPTACQPCNTGFYTEYWNYIYDCLPCNWCSPNEEVAQECTSSTNRECRCKEGFYKSSHFCREHTVCPKGYGVKEKGTPDRDTVCEPCLEGHYLAGEPGDTRCVPHTACKSEEKLLFAGTNYSDNVCATCSDITRDGWVNLIIKPFMEIFKNHNNRRLHRFIKYITCSDGLDQDHPIQHLQVWLSKAKEHQIISLPNEMHRFKMKVLANKMEHRIQTVLNEVLLCRNTVL